MYSYFPKYAPHSKDGRVNKYQRHGRPRAGFTLLEIMLALAISVLLLSGLYYGMDMTLRQVQAGRELIQEVTLQRAVLNRIQIDLSSGITPITAFNQYQTAMNPNAGLNGTGGQTLTGTSNTPLTSTTTGSTGTTGATGSAGGTSSGSGMSATGGTGSGNSSATGSSSGGSSGGSMSGGSSGSSSSSNSSQPVTNLSIPWQAGVIGDANNLTIYQSRISPSNPLSINNPGNDPSQINSNDPNSFNPQGTGPFPSDVRQITYSLTQDQGLTRTETVWLTSMNAQMIGQQQDPASQTVLVVAPEVTQMTIQYWDGTQWQQSWDGTSLSADGVTPIGPPVAIQVSITIQMPGKNKTKQYNQTIALKSAINSYNVTPQPINQAGGGATTPVTESSSSGTAP